ncbi:MAG TPA: DUF1416 domain-containing protein [Pseudonocardia sp.]|jgi:hypothetical protein
MCAAPDQNAGVPAGVDVERETVVTGQVLGADSSPIGGAYVRLLDSAGEFTAEVVSSATGDFRFFAVPGRWTLRALSRSGNGEASVIAEGPGLHRATVTIG